MSVTLFCTPETNKQTKSEYRTYYLKITQISHGTAQFFIQGQEKILPLHKFYRKVGDKYSCILITFQQVILT